MFTSYTYGSNIYITLQVLHTHWYERRLYMLCQQHPHYFWDLVFSIKCDLIATFQIQPWAKLRKSSLLWLWEEAKNFEFQLTLLCCCFIKTILIRRSLLQNGNILKRLFVIPFIIIVNSIRLQPVYFRINNGFWRKNKNTDFIYCSEEELFHFKVTVDYYLQFC